MTNKKVNSAKGGRKHVFLDCSRAEAEVVRHMMRRESLMCDVTEGRIYLPSAKTHGKIIKLATNCIYYKVLMQDKPF